MITPGPWSLGKGYGLHGIEVVGDDGNRLVCGVIGVTRDVAQPDGGRTVSKRTDDGWANARLIANAPALLEALERIVALSPYSDDVFTAQALANAAIARATGETR